MAVAVLLVGREGVDGEVSFGPGVVAGTGWDLGDARADKTVLADLWDCRVGGVLGERDGGEGDQGNNRGGREMHICGCVSMRLRG